MHHLARDNWGQWVKGLATEKRSNLSSVPWSPYTKPDVVTHTCNPVHSTGQKQGTLPQNKLEGAHRLPRNYSLTSTCKQHKMTVPILSQACTIHRSVITWEEETSTEEFPDQIGL